MSENPQEKQKRQLEAAAIKATQREHAKMVILGSCMTLISSAGVLNDITTMDIAKALSKEEQNLLKSRTLELTSILQHLATFFSPAGVEPEPGDPPATHERS